MTATDCAWRDAVPTLAIGAAGAGLFWWIGFPAAVLTGPAAAVSAATILGLRTMIPPPLRDAVFLVIGISIGSSATPEVIATALAWPISLFVLVGTLFVILITARAALVRGFRYDRMTALLAATPGHLSFVLSISTDVSADVRRVALVQSMRVLMLTLLVPVLITLWGVRGTITITDPALIAPGALVLTAGLALGLGLVLKRLRVPAPLLLGAMVVSAIGHGADLTPGAVPSWLQALAFIAMGALIGTRFSGFDRHALRAAVSAGVVMTLIACAVAALGAMIAAKFVGLQPAVLLLAFAPGGVEVMAAIAVETGLQPAFVAAHHVIRLLALGLIIPFLVSRIRLE